MLESKRKQLKNAQPISSPAQWNYEQQSPDQPGSGHAAFKGHETGTGTNIVTLQRALARVNAQLAVTQDPQLRIQLLSAQRNLTNQMLRSSGSGTGDQIGSPVPDVGFPMGTYVDSKSGGTSHFSGPLSPKATFELAHTLRSTIQQPLTAGVTPAGFPTDPEPDRNMPKTVSNPTGSGFPQTNAPIAHPGSPGTTPRPKSRPFIPGRTHHKAAVTGPNGKGLVTSAQPMPGKHGGRHAVGN